MNRMLLVCLIAATFTITVTLPSRAQAPALRKGVSVQMASTRNASPMAEADNDDAWVVAISAGGDLYLGTEAMTPDQLAEWMRSHPRSRESNLYIKADARASFANVEKVLNIGRVMGFDAPVLLTSQVEPKTPGIMVPPKGLAVSVDAPATGNSIVVRIARSQDSSTVSVNNEETSLAALQGTVRGLIQNATGHVVIVRADGAVPFRDFINVVDICTSVGAKTIVPTPQI